MSTTEITITGVLYDKLSRSTRPVTIIGEAVLSGQGGGGGGPVDPGYDRPEGGGGHPGNRPPGSWGGEHPGNRPPGSWDGNYPSMGPVPPGGPTDPGYGRPDWGGHPGNRPPGSWGGEHPGNRPPGSGEYPSGGPVIPPKPEEPPPDGADKPPPDGGGWGFVAEWSQWGYFPSEGEAQPK